MYKEHLVVYRETGKFAGWPANYGMWAWDNGLGGEIVVGFTQCTQLAKAGFHSRTPELPATPRRRALWMAGAPGQPAASRQPRPMVAAFLPMNI